MERRAGRRRTARRRRCAGAHGVGRAGDMVEAHDGVAGELGEQSIAEKRGMSFLGESEQGKARLPLLVVRLCSSVTCHNSVV
jgi:hypothetical protein